MLPKLGIVSIGVHDDILNGVARYKLVSILIVNERGQSRPERPWENNEIDRIRATMAASPKTLWIFRSWPDGIGENVPGWSLWDRLIKCFEPFRGMSNPLMAHGYNEPGDPWVFTERGAMALAAIETKFAQRIHDAGLLYGGLCFPESHLGKDHLHLWKQLAPVLAHLDAWIPNEYDWPNWDTSRDQGYKWRIGHWEHQVERLRSLSYPDDKIPPVIIGEGILDGKIQYPHPHGWQKKQPYSPRRYVDTHQAVYDDTYHKPEVFAHHTFCYCHPSSEWNSYSVKPILYQLGQLVQNQVYWENYHKEEKVGIWKNVPPQIAQWRPVIETVTSSFHVPIPDYKGVHLSPAKLLACMIMRESLGNARTTNVQTKAAGLMQIMPFHFEPGQDPYEPEWNIWKGLAILRDKLYPKNAPPRPLQKALFYYSGRADRPWQPFIDKYWNFIVEKYKQFWGVDLEPAPEPNHIQEALLEIARAKAKIGGIPYLVKEAEDGLEAAIKTLSGEDA